MSAVAAALLAATGCGSTSPAGSLADVSAAARQRLGAEIVWQHDEDSRRVVADRVRQLLAGPLTLGHAVAVALLNNAGLQAEIEELGIAQADLVQAGLLANPTFGASVRFPAAAGANVDSDFSITQPFLDIFVLPLRKRVAAAQAERAKLSVSDVVLRLAAEVRAAFIQLQGAEQLVAMWRMVVDGQRAAADLAQRQLDAGNIYELDAALQIDAYEAQRVSLARAETDVLSARERLARLLGVWGRDVAFRLAGPFPEISANEAPQPELEAMAIAQRLDLAAARHDRDAVGYIVTLERDTRFVPAVDIGVSTQKESPEGVRVTGPTVALELPIFDQKQARIARLEAQLRQLDDRVAELAVNVRSQVRDARNRVVAAHDLVDQYRRVVLPRRERVVALSQLQYNAMQIGPYQLLTAKQNQITAYREYIELVRDYWLARSGLELAVGAPVGNSRPE